MSAAVPLADAAQRRRIEEALGTTLVVEAAAGTGKTTALIGRMIALIKAGRGSLPRMVALTFTDKAAGEMKLRLRAALESARQAAGDDRAVAERLELALHDLEVAHIETIHAFCGDLLQQRPIEAGVDPRFEVGADGETEALLDEAFGRFLERCLQDPPAGIRRALRRSGGGRDPVAGLKLAARDLVEHRDFPAAFSSPVLDRPARIDLAFDALEKLGNLSKRSPNRSDPLRKDLKEIADFIERHSGLAAARGEHDYDELEFALGQLSRRWIWRRTGRGAWFAPGVSRQDVLRMREETKATLDGTLADLEADLAAALREDLRQVVTDYEAAKAKVGCLDYLDLLVKTRDLLRDQGSVRRDIQRRYTHVFVDEFQDTDPLQADIIRLLCLDPEGSPHGDGFEGLTPGKLFVVGDPKQSIYRFRRADVMLYERIKRALCAEGAEVLHLSTSFRSVPALQSLVNASFQAHMVATDDGGQAAYLPLSPFRTDHEGQPAVVALPVPRPYGPYGQVTNGAVEASLPDAVGAFVAFLVNESGYTVLEGGSRVPLSARHICLLFRRLKTQHGEITREYVRALEARSIPHVLLGGRDFHRREEVAALTTALSAIEWPGDTLHVYSCLRGPLFALSDEALFDYGEHVGPLHPLHRPRSELSESQTEVAEAMAVLRDLHLIRNRRSCAETVHGLLDATRAHAAFAIWPNGEQALANVLRIADQALRFERRGTTSFRAFVQWLLDAQAGDATRGALAIGDAPVVEDGTEGVRMMTVHGAKGLEFPVVILCEPTASRTPSYPSRYVDSERGLWAMPLCQCTPADLHAHREEVLQQDAAELVRLAYVAATRAADMLVVPVVGDEPKAGWVDVLHGGLYPAATDRRASTVAPGCPRRGKDSVLEASVRARRTPEDSVLPGLVRPQRGDHRVVFWDPATLTLDAEGSGGLRQQELLMEDAGEGHAAAGRAQYQRWQARRTRAIEAGSRAIHQVTTVTAASHVAERPAPSEGPAPARRAVHVEQVQTRRSNRPAGKRFGSLLHAVLADSEFRDEPSWLTALATLHGRLLGATEQERDEAVVAATVALTHPRLRAAAQSSNRRLEAPLSMHDAGTPNAGVVHEGTVHEGTVHEGTVHKGTVVEGVADLAYLDANAAPARWVVVDFKSDRDHDQPHYRAQVSLYADAIERATGLPCEAVLLGV